jgi:hypothetical protein
VGRISARVSFGFPVQAFGDFLAALSAVAGEGGFGDEDVTAAAAGPGIEFSFHVRGGRRFSESPDQSTS